MKERKIMTDTTLSRGLPAGRYGFGDVARMEWIKLRTLRSTTWVLGIGMAATVGLGAVAGYNTRSVTSDPTSNVLSGIILGQVIMGVLGVLVMTSEYSSGLIRVTLAAVPRRPLVLSAKALVFGAVCLLLGEVTVFASFLAGIAALRPSVPHPALTQGPVLRAVAMTGIYLALVGLTGLGIGAIVRHSAAAAATVVGGLFVLPLIVGAASHAVGKFMPELIAGNSLSAVKPVQGFSSWSPWLELGIVAVYPAVLLACGCWQLVRRDA
jgi:ABC-type transport system involved in multi-copper enzyme maturation permease subunit